MNWTPAPSGLALELGGYAARFDGAGYVVHAPSGGAFAYALSLAEAEAKIEDARKEGLWT